MKWIYFIVLFIVLSCSEKRTERYSYYYDFPINECLTSHVIPLDKVLLKYPFSISIHDSSAIVLDIHNQEYYFHAFTYPGFKHIVSFGKRGDGPEEILLAESFQYINNDTIWVLDANKMQITRWSISISERAAKQREKILLDGSLIRTLDFICFKDSCFIVPDYTGSSRIVQITKDGEILNKIGYLPTEKNYLNEASPSMAQAWRSFIDYNQDKGIMAVATQLGEVLEIYDMKGNTRKVLYGPNGEPDFEIANGYGIPTGIMGFSDVKVTDKYIYTVFHGRSFREISKQVRKGIKGQDGGKYIYDPLAELN